MIQKQLFVCGSGLLSHPVTYLFHLDEDVANGDPEGALDDKLLAVVDCRLAEPAQSAAWARVAAEQRKPVLLLCPGLADLGALAPVAGVVPDGAAAAVLVVPRVDGEGTRIGSEVLVLAYPATPGGASQEGRALEGADGRGSAASTGECACTDVATLAALAIEPASAERFKFDVERAMERGAIVSTDPIPTGLKYFHNVLSVQTPFTYSQGGESNPTAGVMSITWTIWGFLSVSATQQMQYLAVEGSLSLSPGTLRNNDECDRGFFNTYLTSTLTPPMSPAEYVPASGGSGTQYTVSKDISYVPPTGGYKIWTYSRSFADSFDGWSVKSISSGNSQGSMWWMNTPCDGSNISGTWSDAFNTWGHVGDIPGPSSGSVAVHSAGIWVNTGSPLSGLVTVPGTAGWQGARLWGSSCSPGVYWYTNAGWNWFTWPYTGFQVDFTPITSAE